jgi:hypothetical protein
MPAVAIMPAVTIMPAMAIMAAVITMVVSTIVTAVVWIEPIWIPVHPTVGIVVRIIVVRVIIAVVVPFVIIRIAVIRSYRTTTTDEEQGRYKQTKFHISPPLPIAIYYLFAPFNIYKHSWSNRGGPEWRMAIEQ